MTILMHYLTCGCIRRPTLFQQPTKFRSGFRDPKPILRKFYAPRAVRLNKTIYQQVLKEVQLYFSDIFHNLRPYHFNDRLSDLAEPTSPGLFFKRKGFRTKAEVLSDSKALQRLRYTVHRMKSGIEREADKYLSTVVVADAKFDINSCKTKARVVWVYPLEICAAENMFFAAIKDNLPDDWVPTPAKYHFRFCGRSSGSADYSNFDSTVPRKVIYDAFSIMRSWFSFSTYVGGAKPYSTTSLDRLWSFLREYFINTPHILPDSPDILRHKTNGVPSGSMFTNIVDTISSRIITTYLHRVNKCQATVTTYGDDVHFRDCVCQPPELETRAGTDFNMRLKYEPPNEHGCLTYCKAECHQAKPYHEGAWYVNILNCCQTRYKGATTECLMYTEPTRMQMSQLRDIVAVHPPERTKWFDRWQRKFFEYWPKFKKKVSGL